MFAIPERAITMTFPRQPWLFGATAVVAILATAGFGYASQHAGRTASSVRQVHVVSAPGPADRKAVAAVVAGGKVVRPAVPQASPGNSPTGTYASLRPTKVLDTQAGVGVHKGALKRGTTLALKVAGLAGIPTSGASAVVLSVTVKQAAAAGSLTVYAAGTKRPATPNLSFTKANTVQNLVIAAVGSNGKVDFYNSAGPIQLRADVSGYFAPGSTSYEASVSNSQLLYNSAYQLATSSGSFTEYFTRYYNFKIPAITQSVLDTGSVQVFFAPDVANQPSQWQPLPFSFTDFGAEFNWNVVYTTSVGQVQLGLFFSPLNPSATMPTLSTYSFPTYDFKVVVTPSTAG